jgi:hypothetical protein
LVIAQFLAFHDLRKERDAEDLAYFRLLGKPRWQAYAHPYDSKTGELYGVSQPEVYLGNPELQLDMSGDFDAVVYGGSEGGYLFDFKWSVRNPPSGFLVVAPSIPDQAISLEAGKGFPFKATITLKVERIRLSAALQTLGGGSTDPVLGGDLW